MRGSNRVPGQGERVLTKLRLGSVLIAFLALLAVGGGIVSPYDPINQDQGSVLQEPSRAHPLGTDALGRDLLARTAHGARISLFVAAAATFLMVLIGFPLGAVAGYYGGLLDTVIMRSADVFLAFPFAVGSIALMAVIGPGVGNIVAALAVMGWPQIARVVRSEVVNEASQDYIAAVRLVGASDRYIIRRHLLRRAAGPTAVFSFMGAGSAVLAESTLSFLGIGVQLPDPSWGSMLAEAVGRLTVAPWLMYGPGAAIFLTCLGFNLLGEGLRDALES